MTTFADLDDSPLLIRALNVGDSGGGKTGALASLAGAGYRLWIMDYDNNIQVLKTIIREKFPSAAPNITYETIRDTITMTGGKPMVKAPPMAFKRAGKLLGEWSADTWGPNDILCLDTLWSMSNAAFNEATFSQGRLNQRAQLSDYGWMADSVMGFIQMIATLKCHIIVNTHIRYLGGADAGDEDAKPQDTLPFRGLPSAKGQQVSNDLSKLFNTQLVTMVKGIGPASKRVISTQPQGLVSAKTCSPFTVKAEYPLETGLASLFEDILGHKPGAVPPTITQGPTS